MSDPTPYGQRLKKALLLAGYGEKSKPDELRRDAREKLAEALDISVQAVGMVLTGKTKAFAPDNSARAARFLKVDHYWLATGEGEARPPNTLSEEAMAFARRYDKLDAEGRAKFSAAIVLARPGVSDEEVERSMPITAKRAKQEN
jgi:transcriptional regulator with XRE-family HTH domain